MESNENENGIKFKVNTPIFSYGADTYNDPKNDIYVEPEIRPASIKGMMRYMFRITQPVMGISDLLIKENALFGDAENSASPVRLAVVDSNKISFEVGKFLFHDKEGYNPERKYISSTSEFSIRLKIRKDLDQLNRLRKKSKQGELTELENQRLGKLNEKDSKGYLKEESWYESLLDLSFILIGLGQRSRKGRGRAQIQASDYTIDSLKELLNKVSLSKEAKPYERFKDEKSRDGIRLKESVAKLSSGIKRPIIEKIIFGNLKKISGEKFLEMVDQASHDIKWEKHDRGKPLKSKLWEKDARQIKNIKEGEWIEKRYHATGESSPRFASSVIVGCIQIGDRIMPTYTCVRPVIRPMKNDVKRKKIKQEFCCRIDADKEWSAFIEKIEGGGRS